MDDADDDDRRAILRRRRRWIALALAGATSTAGLAPGAFAQEDAAASEDAGLADASPPQPCLTAPHGGCEP